MCEPVLDTKKSRHRDFFLLCHGFYVCLKPEMQYMAVLVLIMYLLSAAAVQFAAGNFPVEFMAFPLNAIFLLLWLSACALLYSARGRSSFAAFMLSSRATVLSISVLAAACLVIGLFPQLSPEQAETRGGLAYRLGLYDFMTSWIFIAVLLFFMTHLLLVLIRGWRRNGRIRWFFLLNHAGLLIVLVSGFFGAPDAQTLRVVAVREEPSDVGYRQDGSRVYLGYELTLRDFRVGHYSDGTPSSFMAEVSVGGQNAVLAVNRPYSLSLAEDIYLSGYDTAKGSDSSYCILQIVREPWKYGIFAGILVMIAGAFMLFIGGPSSEKREK